MKNTFIILISIILTSCAFKTPGYDNYKNIQNNTITQVGHINNCTILNNFKEPERKIIYSNKKYAYEYFEFLTKPFFEESNNAMFTFENDILCGVEFYINGMIDKSELRCNNNDWNDNLGSQWNDSKYKYINLIDNPEIDIKKINDNEFYTKIKIGLTKASLFRLVGKPDYSYNHNGEERWKFVAIPINKRPTSCFHYYWCHYIDDKTYTELNDSQKQEIDSGRSLTRRNGKEYIIVLKNNVVIDRFISKEIRSKSLGRIIQSVLTKEEKQCVGE